MNFYEFQEFVRKFQKSHFFRYGLDWIGIMWIIGMIGIMWSIDVYSSYADIGSACRVLVRGGPC